MIPGPAYFTAVTEENSGGVAQVLENQGRLDLSLLVREDDNELPDEPTIGRPRLSLIGPLGDSLVAQSVVDFDRLADIPLILPGEPHLLRARLNVLARERNVKLRVEIEADSIRIQEEIVVAGGGYAIMAVPASHTAEAQRYSSALIVNPELTRRIVVSTTLLRPHTLAMAAVLRLVIKLKSKLMA